jgi:hypothetical protein
VDVDIEIQTIGPYAHQIQARYRVVLVYLGASRLRTSHTFHFLPLRMKRVLPLLLGTGQQGTIAQFLFVPTRTSYRRLAPPALHQLRFCSSIAGMTTGPGHYRPHLLSVVPGAEQGPNGPYVEMDWTEDIDLEAATSLSKRVWGDEPLRVLVLYGSLRQR